MTGQVKHQNSYGGVNGCNSISNQQFDHGRNNSRQKMNVAYFALYITTIESVQFPCSEEYLRESVLYPICIPNICGRHVFQIEQDLNKWRNKILSDISIFIESR